MVLGQSEERLGKKAAMGKFQCTPVPWNFPIAGTFPIEADVAVMANGLLVLTGPAEFVGRPRPGRCARDAYAALAGARKATGRKSVMP
jgi:hypothetical protein